MIPPISSSRAQMPPPSTNSFASRPLHSSLQSLTKEDPLPSYTRWINSFVSGLRWLRKALFSSFISIDPSLEQQRSQEVEAVLVEIQTKRSLAKLSDDPSLFLKTKLQEWLNTLPKQNRKYADAEEMLHKEPCHEKVLLLLQDYLTSRKELLELETILPCVQDPHASASQLHDAFSRLSAPLRSHLLTTLFQIDNSQKAMTLDQILQNPERLPMVRTAVATAVCGLKMHKDRCVWAKEKWRCRFWYN